MDAKHVPSLKAFQAQKMQLEGAGTFDIGGERQELREQMIR